MPSKCLITRTEGICIAPCCGCSARFKHYPRRGWCGSRHLYYGWRIVSLYGIYCRMKFACYGCYILDIGCYEGVLRSILYKRYKLYSIPFLRQKRNGKKHFSFVKTHGLWTLCSKTKPSKKLQDTIQKSIYS